MDKAEGFQWGDGALADESIRYFKEGSKQEVNCWWVPPQMGGQRDRATAPTRGVATLRVAPPRRPGHPQGVSLPRLDRRVQGKLKSCWM